MIALILLRALVGNNVVPLKFYIGYFCVKGKKMNSQIIEEIPNKQIINNF